MAFPRMTPLGASLRVWTANSFKRVFSRGFRPSTRFCLPSRLPSMGRPPAAPMIGQQGKQRFRRSVPGPHRRIWCWHNDRSKSIPTSKRHCLCFLHEGGGEVSELRPQARGRGWEHLEYIGGDWIRQPSSRRGAHRSAGGTVVVGPQWDSPILNPLNRKFECH